MPRAVWLQRYPRVCFNERIHDCAPAHGWWSNARFHRRTHSRSDPRPRTDTDLQPPLLITAIPPQKEFYIIKTRNDKVFYLIIDHTKVSDNVYLVTEVDEADLLNFVESTQMPALLPFLPQATPVSPTIAPDNSSTQAPTASDKPFWGNLQPAMIIVGVVLLLLAGAALFYWKVVSPKTNSAEADFYTDEYLEDSSSKVNAWKESEGEE